jgi:N-acyl-D-amino-acid deacylase
MVDLLMTNGLIIDGTGAPAFIGNIGVDQGKIVSIGNDVTSYAKRLIDASGLVISPGFIDGHTHAEGYLIDSNKQFMGKIYQGVTTEIMGNCGISVVPVLPDHQDDLLNYYKPFSSGIELNWDWYDLTTFRSKMDQKELLLNAGTMVGHGSLRIAVMGYQNRRPNKVEMETMTALLRTAFDQGALGLSFGLIYPPGSYADEEEILHLAKIAAAYDRPITCHLRSETFQLVNSVKEMIHVSEKSGARLVISHHKAIGRKNWHQLTECLDLIDQAILRGKKIYIDVYPYIAANTMLRSLLPPWALNGGIEKMLDIISSSAGRDRVREWIVERNDWENFGLATGWDSIMISSSRDNPAQKGQFIAQLADNSGADPVDFIMDYLLMEEGQGMIVFFAASEKGLWEAMSKPYCMIASDGIPAVGGGHPRLFGTFPRFLFHYVLTEKGLSIEEGIRRITSLPADVFGCEERGALRPGYYADITVFDPKKLRDNASYDNPERLAEGIVYSIINGELCFDHNNILNQKSGTFL